MTSPSKEEEKEEYPNPNEVPMTMLERAFWRRKLPRSMLFYLKGVSRELMLTQPEDANQCAADFFQELLQQRDEELKNLPLNSYLNKIMQKLGVEKSSCEADEPPPPTLNPVKCSRCGRWLNPLAKPETTGPMAANVTTHVEGDEECRVIALPPPERDAFGHLIFHVVPASESCDDEVFNTRSLSYVVDF